MTIRLLIVNDHELMRHGLRKLIDGTEIRVVAETGDSEKAIALVDRHKPDVVLLDLSVMDRKGPSVLEYITQKTPKTAVLILSTNDSIQNVSRARAFGAVGYLSKGCDLDELLTAVRKAAAGKEVWTENQFRQSSDLSISDLPGSYRLDAAIDAPLTARQSEVLRHIASGLTTKEIAKTLDIRYNTAKEHVQNVMRKIGAAGRTEAAVWAVRQGLV